MYAIAIIRYRAPIERITEVTPAHRAYAQGLKEQGLLLASGPMQPRYGGAMLLRVPDEGALAALDRIRDEDPFVQQGVAQYELIPWNPMTGKDELDRL